MLRSQPFISPLPSPSSSTCPQFCTSSLPSPSVDPSLLLPPSNLFYSVPLAFLFPFNHNLSLSLLSSLFSLPLFLSMEEDDEIRLERRRSRSPSPSPAAADTSVTVASVNLPPDGSLSLALPIPQPRTAAGREDCWTEGATAMLIGAWGERYVELNRGNLKQKHWKEVAEIVNGREDCAKPPKTDVQCKNRIDTVKKKYKLEKGKVVAGGGPSKWAFFETMDRLIGPTQAQKPPLIRPAHPIRGNPSKPLPAASPRRRSPKIEDVSSPSFSDDESLTPPAVAPKKARTEVRAAKEESGWGELSRAIRRFGEVYEKAEMVKMKEAVEMEKRWMKLGTELELQRMQQMMETQMEISKIKKKNSQRKKMNCISNRKQREGSSKLE